MKISTKWFLTSCFCGAMALISYFISVAIWGPEFSLPVVLFLLAMVICFCAAFIAKVWSEIP